MTLIHKETLLKYVEDCVRVTHRTGVESAELRGVRKVVDCIEVAPPVNKDAGVLISCSDCGTNTIVKSCSGRLDKCPQCGSFDAEIEVLGVEDEGCFLCNSDRLDSVGINSDEKSISCGVYFSGGSGRPPENEKVKFCPNCGKSLREKI